MGKVFGGVERIYYLSFQEAFIFDVRSIALLQTVVNCRLNLVNKGKDESFEYIQIFGCTGVKIVVCRGRAFIDLSILSRTLLFERYSPLRFLAASMGRIST